MNCLMADVGEEHNLVDTSVEQRIDRCLCGGHFVREGGARAGAGAALSLRLDVNAHNTDPLAIVERLDGRWKELALESGCGTRYHVGRKNGRVRAGALALEIVNKAGEACVTVVKLMVPKSEGVEAELGHHFSVCGALEE